MQNFSFKRQLSQIALLVGLLIPMLTNAQVRPDIYSFTPAQRTQLVNAMMEYIDSNSVQKHCVHQTVSGGHIHSDFDFLPFHRVYLEGMEDYIKTKGAAYDIFIPLPKWDPTTTTPTEFQVIDPDCGSFSCGLRHPASSCGSPINWSPNRSLTRNLQFPNICNLDMDPTSPSSADCCQDGLSRQIEDPWHNPVHGIMGGVMRNFRSPAAPIFWLWHAYVDDVWKTWECNCSKSGLDGTFDFYMKDTPKEVESERDRGEEPNIDSDFMWESTDIWVRRQADGLTNHAHQNPEYHSLNSRSNYVYVQVRNRGCVPSAGTNQLKVYWSKAGTALSYPNHWDGSLTTSNGQPVGDLIATVNLPVIQPGASYIAEVPWQPVDPANYVNLYDSTDALFWISAPEPHHFCLLARIESNSDPITFTDGSAISEYVRQNNNVVWKNLSVVDVDPSERRGGWENDRALGAAVFVGDLLGQGGTYDVEFTNPATHMGNPVTAEAEVKVTLSPHVWRKWRAGGFQGENIRVVKEARHQILVTGSPARIDNLTFDAWEQNLVHVGFNFLSEKLTGQEEFKYHVIQRDHATNQVLGGETYTIRIPGRPGFYADAGGDREISEGESTNLNAYDIGETAIYNWYDQNGNLIYTGKDLTVSPSITEKYKLEVIAELDGVKDYDEIEIKVKEFEIISVSPNPAINQVRIEYKAHNASSTYLMIAMPYGNSHNYILDPNQDQVSINVTDYQTGVYNVILVCNGQIADVSTLIVQ